MSEVADIIRRVEALNKVTVARGAYLGEAANAQRLAQALIKRHGLEARFANGDHRYLDRGFVTEAAENIRRWEQRRSEAEAEARQRQFEEMMARIKREETEHRRAGAKRGWENRRRRKAEDRMKEYKGNHGTVRAVLRLGGGLPVSAKQLAAWYGGITFDAAHGRLWRAQMAGLLKKVKGGYVVA